MDADAGDGDDAADAGDGDDGVDDNDDTDISGKERRIVQHLTKNG